MEKSIKLLAIALIVCTLLFCVAYLISNRYETASTATVVRILDVWTGKWVMGK